MISLIELYIEGILVELDDQVSIPITLQIDDIKDPGSIKNTFSKTISLPNTPNNNILFGNIWNNNKIVLPIVSGGTNSLINFNPSKKASFILNYNGALYQSGYIKMNKINFINANSWRYDVNLFGGLGNFIGALGDDLLKDSFAEKKVYDDEPNNPKLMFDQPIVWNKSTTYNIITNITDNQKSRFNVTNIDDFYNSHFVNLVQCDLNNKLQIYIDANKYSDSVIDFIDSENGLYNNSDKVQYYDGTNSNNDLKQTDLGQEFTETYMRNKLSYKQRYGFYLDRLLMMFPEKYNYSIDWSSIMDVNNPYWFKLLMTCQLPKTIKNVNNCILQNNIVNNLAIGDPSNIEQVQTFNIINNSLNFDIYKSYFYQIMDLKIVTNKLDFTLNNLPTFSQDNFYNTSNTGGKIKITLGNSNINLKDEYPPKINYSIILNLVPWGVANTTYVNDPTYVCAGFNKSAGQTSAELGIVDKMNDPQTPGNVYTPIMTYINKYFSNVIAALYFTNPSTPITIIYEFIKCEFIGFGTGNIYPNQYSVESELDFNLEIRELYEAKSNGGTTLKNMLPTVKTKDFFLSYIKMFGLYLITDDINKKITVKTRNDFYQGYKILDWSDKLCRDREISINPLNIDKGKIRIGYAKKKDSYLNKLYYDKWGQYYGDTIINSGYEFNNDEFDMLSGNIFEPIISKDLTETVLGSEYNDASIQYNMTHSYDRSQFKKIPVIAKESSGKLNEYDAVGLCFMNGNTIYGAGLTYYGYSGNTDVNGILFNCVDDTPQMLKNKDLIHNKQLQKSDIINDEFKFVKQAEDFLTTGQKETIFITNNSFSGDSLNIGYKEAGDGFPRMNSITHSLNFSKPKEIFYNINDQYFPESATIYNRYWKKYIEDRYNINTKVMDAYFYLTPLDVQTFDFKNFIFIDGSLWSVNKISDFDISQNKPTKVELVKVNDIQNYVNGQTPY